MSTPRTDAVVAPFIGRDDISVEEATALLDHARELERELAEALEDANKAGAVVSIHMMESRRLYEELSAHKAALEMAEKALKTFDGVFAFGGVKAHTEEELKLVREAQAAIAKAKGTK